MHDDTEGDITRVLNGVAEGDGTKVDALLPAVYDELRRLAQHQLAMERRDHTLQATALVHEAYLRLVDQTRVHWNGRAHFLAVASQVIRRVLVDHARSRGRLKRGGARARVALGEEIGAAEGPDVLELDDALRALAEESGERAAVVEMRFFGGMTNEEIAQVLGVSERTIERRWRYARAWLYRVMGEDTGAGDG